MNELIIRELAELASHQSPDGYPVTIPYSKDFAIKLVELVVKECLMLNAKELSAAAQFRMFDIYWDHFGLKE